MEEYALRVEFAVDPFVLNHILRIKTDRNHTITLVLTDELVEETIKHLKKMIDAKRKHCERNKDPNSS